MEAAINTFDAGARDELYKSVVLAGIKTLDEGKYDVYTLYS